MLTKAFPHLLSPTPTPKIGVTPPLGLFDPSNLYTGQDKATQTKLRTTEIKHERLVMPAALGITGPERLLPTHPSALSLSSPLIGVAVAFLPGIAWEVYESFLSQKEDNGKESATAQRNKKPSRASSGRNVLISRRSGRPQGNE